MKDKRKRIALFGGSFDPPHAEHTDIIFKLADKFDKVIVLPACISPFKQKAKTAPGEDRVRMLESVGFPENVKISRHELKNGGVSYSYLTAQHYAQKYPEAKLYFVVGSDALSSLESWENADVLAATVRFYVIEREGFPIEDARVEELSAKGFKVKVSKISCPDVSSSAVKAALAFDRSDGLDKPVADYIREKGLYGEYRAITDRYPEFSMKPERIEHTYRAVMTGIDLAKRNGVSVPDTVTALLLHDIGKYATPAILEQYGIEVPDEVKAWPEAVRHAPIGALIAQKVFKVRKKAILDAIWYHTTAKPKMSPLGEVVYMADFIEPGRTFPRVAEIRAVTVRSIKLGIEAGLKDTIEHLSSLDKDRLCPITLEAYEYYRHKNDPSLKKKRSAKTVRASRSEAGPEEEREDKVPAKTPPAKKASVKTTAAKKAAPKEQSPVASPEEKGAKTAKKRPAAKQTESAFEPPEALDTPEKLARSIAFFLSEKKARDIRILDIASRSVLADYFVIASGGSSTQVRALVDHVDEKLSKGYGLEPLHRDRDAKWIAVDYGSVILHVFSEEQRAFYQLERLWSDGTNELKQ